MSDVRFSAILGDSLERLQQGEGETRSEGPVPACIKGFDSVFLTGGASKGVAESLEHGPWSLIKDSWDGAAQHPGGAALLAQHQLNGWTVDLGQSALKVWGEDCSERWERNLARLPVRTPDLKQLESEQREELRRFVSGALRAFGQRSVSISNPGGLVFALPSRLDDAGVPEGSSYIGMGGDVSLVRDVVARAEMASTQVLMLNDAELAAVAAQSSGKITSKTLVLTLGFGIGAALIS